MSVAKVVEISATSPDSFEDAIRQAIAKANETLRGIRSAWVKEQLAHVENGAVTEFQVNVQITFVLE
jgi:flavin-binding protein dodecin